MPTYSFDLETLNERALFEYCQKIGKIALKSRREFVGLLPLVERRRAYQGRGYYSIFDFAAKSGGIGREIVVEVLRLDAQLHNFPLIRKLLYSGRIGWSKIRMVVHWITAETQNEWIGKLEGLSYAALSTYLRDFMKQQKGEIQTLQSAQSADQLVRPQQLTNENSTSKLTFFEKTGQNKAENFRTEILEGNEYMVESQKNAETIPGMQVVSKAASKFESLSYYRETLSFSLRSDLAARLRLFRQILEKQRRELVTWEEVMIEFLKLIEEKRDPNGPNPHARQSEPQGQTTASRTIPAAVKRKIIEHYEGLCAFRQCNKPAEILHHTRRFALTNSMTTSQAHDPLYIKPLCKEHERIVHATLVVDEEIDPSTWKLLPAPDTTSEKYKIDQKVNSFRKPP